MVVCTKERKAKEKKKLTDRQIDRQTAIGTDRQTAIGRQTDRRGKSRKKRIKILSE